MMDAVLLVQIKYLLALNEMIDGVLLVQIKYLLA